jgi:glycosyltransferase involved in cell wall biosynthesis
MSKILHVSTATSWRGGEQQIAYLLQEISLAGREQVVCCPNGSPLSDYCKKTGIHHHDFHSRGILDLSLAKKLRFICRDEKVTVIHAHDSHAHSAAVLSSSVFGNKTPVVLSRRVDFPVSQNLFSKWKYNHSIIKKILCVSEKIREITGRDIGDKNKLIVIYDGIDLSKFNPGKRKFLLLHEWGLSKEVQLVGNASALAGHKDYFTFVDTAEIVMQKKPDVRFAIIGQGPDQKSIEEYIERKNLRDKIFFAGFRDNIAELLPELDVFLMTSITEGLGSILLDAFASGVPVVATCAGGIPEIVSDGQTGLLAPVKDAAKLAQQVCLLLEDASARTKMKDKAMQFVQNFSHRKMALLTMEVYDAVDP